jgi:hypothetical protein
MKNKIIYSENPYEHWSDITDVSGKIVLDLGCGWINQGHESTTEYFIKRGAAKIIGVDINESEIQKLQAIYPNHVFICKAIETKTDLFDLIAQYKPEVVKMDIEGFEKVLKFLGSLLTVNEVAVEYHDNECKNIILTKLDELRFDVFAINSFGYHCLDIEIMGVIHAKK